MDKQHRKATYNACDPTQDQPPQTALTIEEVLDHIGFGLPQIKIIIMAGVAWIAAGMEIMVLSILGPILEYEWHITPVQQAFLTMVVMLGYAFGSLAFGYISDNYGRKTCLILSGPCSMVSMWTLFYGVLCSAAPNFAWIMILRMLLGFGVGGSNIVVTYYTEFLPCRYRGKFSIFLLVFWAIGSLTAVLTAMALVQYGWRYWILSTVVPVVVFLCLTPFIPESPRYKLACGRKADALQILSDIAAANGKSLHNVDIVDLQNKPKGRLADLFVPDLRRTSILVVIILFNLGFLYYGIVLFSTYIIRDGNTCSMNLLGNPEAECSLGVQPLSMANYVDLLWTTSAEIPGLLITLLLVDTIGRKFGTFWESLVVGVSCLLLNICMPKIPVVILLFLGRGLSNSGYQMMLLYSSECYPTEIRSLGNGMANMASLCGGTVTPFIANVVFAWSYHIGMFIYTVIAVLTAVALALLPYDTKGMHMADNLASQ